LIESDALAVDLEVLGGHVVRSSRYTNPKRLLISRVGYDARGREQRVYGSAVASAWFDNGAGFLGADVTQDELRTVDTRVSGARERSTHERGNRGAFASGEVSVGPVSIHGGVRVESVEGIPGQWSPGGGVIAEVGGGVSVVGNVARAWRAPSFDELYLDQEFLVGDPDLGPEEAVSADAGLRWELGGAVRVEAVAFWVDIDDTILFLPVSPSLFRAQNTGGAQSRGAEVTVLLRHDWWAVEAAYTLTDARFDAVPRDPLPGQPRHRVHGELRLLRPNVEFFGRVRARSEVFLDNFSNLRDEPVAFVDAGAVGEPLRGWKIAVLGRNLTDVRTSEDHLQQPLPGLSWHIQLSARVGE
jgi:outer membrane receptor protein involved in Fe transport